MLIDPAKSRQLIEHKHDAPLMCCAFDASGRFVLAGGRDRAVVCLDVASGNPTALAGHESWIGAVVRAGAELVLTSDYAGRVIAWDCTGESPQPRWNIAAHASTIYALAASHDGKLFATGDRDGTIRLWRTEDGQRAQELTKLEHPVYGLAFHPDGNQLVSADRQPKSPRLKIWNLATGCERSGIDVPQLSAYRRVEDIEWGGIRAIVLSADGDTLVACGSNGYAGPACALLFDTATGEPRGQLASSLKGFYYSALFHPQGFLLTAGGDVGKGEFRAWDSSNGEPLATVATAGPCTSIDVHPDGQRCVVAQMIGKGSYPDSGSLTLFEWLP
jgi:WD40 repeat protein